MDAYHSNFGKEHEGEPSALRASFMVNYLMKKYEDSWKGYCVDILKKPEIAHMMAGASKGRWWSVILGFGDAYIHRSAISDSCNRQAAQQGSSSGDIPTFYNTFGPLFETTAAWLVTQ